MRNRFLLACWLVVGVAHVACHGQATPLKAEIKLIRTSVKNNELFWVATSIRNTTSEERLIVVLACGYCYQWEADNPSIDVRTESCLNNGLGRVKLKPGGAYEKKIKAFVTLPAGAAATAPVPFRLGFVSEMDPFAPRPRDTQAGTGSRKFTLLEDRRPAPLWSNPVTVHVTR